MKQRALLRKILSLLLLTTLLLAMSLPASALPFGKGAQDVPMVSAFSKNGPISGVITFAQDDFQISGKGALDAIVLTELPVLEAGTLTLGEQEVHVGDTIAMKAVDGLRFTPMASPTVSATGFSFTPVFSDGQTGDRVAVSPHLLAAENGAPIAENLTLSTYKNVAVTGQFSATDPEGDILTFRLLEKPARGALTMPEDGSAEFVYTPYENKTGKDSFTYIAMDAVGNSSAPATVKIRIEKQNTKVTYADMGGNAAHRDAIRLAEAEVFIGECMGGNYFFHPAAPVSRGEFVAMAMNAVGVQALEGVERTGFADDLTIPTWAKPYVSSALKSGLITGAPDERGQIVFNAAAPITRGEAAVLLNRMLQIADVATETLYVDSVSAPVWAHQAAVNLETCSVLRTDSTGALALEGSITRAAAAELLCGALDVLETRESGNWFGF